MTLPVQCVRVLINADDLGINQIVNNAIFDLMDTGRVTSATMIANGPAIGNAAAGAGAFPNASFGIHLNATEFAPLTKNRDLAPILNPDGCFAGNIRDVKLDTRLKAALTAEWISQVEYVRSLGVKVSHIDSHHHIHTVPQLFRALKDVQSHCQIRKVRIAKNIYSSTMPPNSRLLPVMKCGWNFLLRRLWYPTITTEGMTEFRTFLEIKKCRYGSVELMTHPGNPNYEDESKLLASRWESELPFPITIINYNQL